jgi:Flp pilus assembly protein TadB
VEMSKITVIAISGIVLLAVAALALVAVHLWRKKSQTEQKYASLVQVLTLHTCTEPARIHLMAARVSHTHTHTHTHRTQETTAPMEMQDLDHDVDEGINA